MFINWSPIRKLIWLKASGAIVPDLPWKTITGNPLSFIARTAHALKSCVVGIEPVQDLHGQANPYPAGGGKNLINNERYNASSNVFFGGATSNAATSNPSIILPAGTYTLSVETADGATTNLYGRNRTTQVDIFAAYNVKSKSFTLTETTELILWAYKSGYSSADAIKTVQVESGSSATSYAPYSNICPISGFTGANVTRTGKNLVPVLTGYNSNGLTVDANSDGSLRIHGKATGSGGYITSGIATLSQKISSGQNFTISVTNNVPVRICYFLYLDGTSKQSLDISANSNSATNTASSQLNGVRLYVSTVANTDYDFTIYPQLELGSTATSYEKNNSITIPISWQSEAGTVYGGSLDVTTGVLTVTRKAITVNGTQSVNASSSNRFYINIGEAKKVDATNQNTLDTTISDRFKSVTWGRLSYPDGNLSCAPVYGNGIAFRDDSITTAADWVTYFTNNPTQFSYELNTPVTYQLTAQQVSAIVGENNMWTDCATLTVEAKAMD